MPKRRDRYSDIKYGENYYKGSYDGYKRPSWDSGEYLDYERPFWDSGEYLDYGYDYISWDSGEYLLFSVSEVDKSEYGLRRAIGELLDRLDRQKAPILAAAKKVLSIFLAHGSEEASQELQDEEMLSDVLDCATESLARTAAMAQETVEHRRALLREMAVRERQIDQKLARTARTLERLVAG